MSPVVVSGFEMDAMEYIVLGVAGIIRSRSAQPKDSSQMTRPSFATATDMDGIPPPATASRIVARTSAKAGFGTVALVGSCAKTEPTDDRRRQAAAADGSEARCAFIVAGPRRRIVKRPSIRATPPR